jgi:hypothetical protein
MANVYLLHCYTGMAHGHCSIKRHHHHSTQIRHIGLVDRKINPHFMILIELGRERPSYILYMLARNLGLCMWDRHMAPRSTHNRQDRYNLKDVRSCSRNRIGCQGHLN